MTRDDIVSLLQELGAELASHGHQAEILIAGGAAAILLVGHRDVTKDIDAYLGKDADVVRRAAGQVAARHDLPPDWINDGVKGFFYGTPPQEEILRIPGLTVFSVTPEYLLAMKCVAARPGDIGDIEALTKRLGIKTAEDALNVVARYLPPSLMTARVKYFVESVIGSQEA